MPLPPEKFTHQQEKVLRDLIFSCYSPHLIALPLGSEHFQSYEKNTADNFINQHCKDIQLWPSPPLTDTLRQTLTHSFDSLTQFLESQNTAILGTYFESLWHFYLKLLPNIQQYQTNIQVFDDKKTIGEYDVVYTTKNDSQLHHLELAVKFYLGIPSYHQQHSSLPLNSPKRWIGPRCRDRLDIKWERLLSHQLQLGLSALGQNTLQLLNEQFSPKLIHNSMTLSIQRELMMTGRLYYPIKDALPSPLGVDKRHLKGYWCHEHQIHSGIKWIIQHNAKLKKRISPLYFYVKPKKEWLSPTVISLREIQQTDSKASLLTDKQLSAFLQQHFAQKEYPVLIAVLVFQDESSYYLQVDELFVTPNDWPILGVDD